MVPFFALGFGGRSGAGAVEIGVVVNGDPASLAAGIAQMLSDADALHRMSANGSAAVARQYGWDSVAKQMECLYQACLIDRSRKSAS